MASLQDNTDTTMETPTTPTTPPTTTVCPTNWTNGVASKVRIVKEKENVVIKRTTSQDLTATKQQRKQTIHQKQLNTFTYKGKVILKLFSFSLTIDFAIRGGFRTCQQ